MQYEYFRLNLFKGLVFALKSIYLEYHITENETETPMVIRVLVMGLIGLSAYYVD